MSRDSILFGIAIGLAIGIAFLIGRRTARVEFREQVVERVDTLFIRDTICVSEPIYVARRVVDSVLVPVVDTIRMRDTLYVQMEREQVQWRDSLSEVYASGINPQVDSVRHFVTERIVTRDVPVERWRRTRWGIGIQAGYGAGREGLTPYLGVGVSYNILAW